MTVTATVTDDSTLIIRIANRFDITTYVDFKDAFSDRLDRISKTILDFSGVEFVDSTALGMLLMLREQAGGDAADITIRGCGAEIKTIFDTVNFGQLFKFE